MAQGSRAYGSVDTPEDGSGGESVFSPLAGRMNAAEEVWRAYGSGGAAWMAFQRHALELSVPPACRAR